MIKNYEVVDLPLVTILSMMVRAPFNELRAIPVYEKQLPYSLANCADSWRHHYFSLKIAEERSTHKTSKLVISVSG